MKTTVWILSRSQKNWCKRLKVRRLYYFLSEKVFFSIIPRLQHVPSVVTVVSCTVVPFGAAVMNQSMTSCKKSKIELPEL